jgi:hypothetical protein
VTANLRERSSSDDMLVWPDGLPSGVIPLRNAMVEAYTQADARAGRYRRFHQLVTWTGAFCGTLAVCAAIVQLYDPAFVEVRELEPWLAAAALVAVLFGLLLAFMPEWILERHKAERLRLLKYRLLLDVMAAADARGRQDGIDAAHRALAEIEAMDEHALDLWIENAPNPPAMDDLDGDASPALLAFARHYADARVRVHQTFFHATAGRQLTFDVLSRYVPAACFFASILLAFVHFAGEVVWVHQLAERTRWLAWLVGGEDTGHTQLLWTALLPVLGAGVRTVRGTFEFSRNSLRYRAYFQALRDVSHRLTEELEREHPSAPMLAGLIAHGEHLLEDEHREWLRLTKETEWFA